MLDDQDAVVDLSFLLDLALVRKNVIAEVYRVGETILENANRPAIGDLKRDLNECGVLRQVGRPWRATDLAPHFDVLDRVRNAVPADVGKFPRRFVKEVPRAFEEPPSPF
jgi:hypothetical protein